MTFIQFIFLFIILLIIVQTARKYQAQLITIRECFLWMAFWLLAGVLVIFPNTTQTIANFVGIGRGVDLLIYMALVVLFTALFFLIVRVERIERDITKIVRHMALQKDNK
jgi:hypothetical protein